MKLIIIVCVLINLAQIVCSLECDRYCNGTRHTECFPAGGGDDCANNEKVYLNDDEKRAILDFHNDKRTAVADGKLLGRLNTKCSNMMKIVWSGEMGLLAKRWADQCLEGPHDMCRTAKDGNETGQNSYVGTFKKTGSVSTQLVAERYDRIMMMLNTWFNETVHLTESDINRFDESRSEIIGNVTQMIWANTIYMACGYTEFTLSGGYLMFRFICDYKPAGNIPSKAVFRKGKPCSRCKGSKCSENYATLCFNGEKNDFIDDNKAHISKPAVYTITLFGFIALLRALRCTVDR